MGRKRQINDRAVRSRSCDNPMATGSTAPHAVSFESVTQSFNTASSMGRLTLNVLLSFAQFERVLIGERVRDKIAASKRKGIWVGGPVPLGYRRIDKKLIVVPEEADTVRTIFRRYLELRLRRHPLQGGTAAASPPEPVLPRQDRLPRRGSRRRA